MAGKNLETTVAPVKIGRVFPKKNKATEMNRHVSFTQSYNVVTIAGDNVNDFETTTSRRQVVRGLQRSIDEDYESPYSNNVETIGVNKMQNILTTSIPSQNDRKLQSKNKTTEMRVQVPTTPSRKKNMKVTDSGRSALKTRAGKRGRSFGRPKWDGILSKKMVAVLDNQTSSMSTTTEAMNKSKEISIGVKI
jgi:predicted metal-dependent peptidase